MTPTQVWKPVSRSPAENQNPTGDSSNVKGKHAQVWKPVLRSPTEKSESDWLFFKCEGKQAQVWKPVLRSLTENQNPTDDSPYSKAKLALVVERNPNKAITLFCTAIESGDRADSALKDMAYVMKGLGRTDKAIEAIIYYRELCSSQSKESLNNVLIHLYKKAGRIDEHIKLLQHKLKLIEEGSAFGGKGTKIVRFEGRRVHVPIEHEKSRLLGNLAWLYMQKKNYHLAEPLYRDALCIEPDKNKEFNLAICLMKYRGRLSEAKSLLQAVRHSSEGRGIADSYIKSYNRAWEMLTKLESQSVLNYPPLPHPQQIFQPVYFQPAYPMFNGVYPVVSLDQYGRQMLNGGGGGYHYYQYPQQYYQCFDHPPAMFNPMLSPYEDFSYQHPMLNPVVNGVEMVSRHLNINGGSAGTNTGGNN